ncbi:hypothetical protein HGRIS_012062 [Hohenbuehelia grisea]|uniref:Uncharacterized protein n=1 Tax=Hohenbuehelia grisea TaxID=104357 RepID=A0ABR3IR57_9AGAR
MAEQVTEVVDPSVGGSISAIELYAAYPFESDEEFQQGIMSLNASGAFAGLTEESKQESLRRARVFYFNRKTANNLTFDEARDRENSGSTSALSENASASATVPSDESRVLTFAELQELIESGKVDQIPNNRVIPDALNVGIRKRYPASCASIH